MNRHRYPGWKSGLREGCQLISHLPSHTGANHHDGGGGGGSSGDDDVYIGDDSDDVYDDNINNIDAL